MSKHETRGRRRVKVEAHEITDADVDFVSLVGKAASRLPIRILKSDEPQEKQMINISNMFGRVKKADGPTIVALAVNPAVADNEELMGFLKDRGFDTENVVEHEGVQLLKQEDFDFAEDDLKSVKLDDNVGALVRVSKRFDPAFMSSDFAENLSSNGFFPSVIQATEALVDTIRGVMEESSNTGELEDGLSQAINDYRDYVEGMAAGMPDTLFKFDAAVSTELKTRLDKLLVTAAPETAEAEAADTETPEAETPEAETGEPKASDTAEAETAELSEDEQKAAATAEDDAPEAGGETAEANEGGEKAEATSEDAGGEGAEAPVAETVQKGEDVLAGMKALLEEQIAPIQKGLNELGTRMEAAEKTVKKADERGSEMEKRIFGTVLSEDAGDEGAPKVRKSDEGSDVWAGTALDRLV